VYIVLAVAIIYACGFTESAFRITGGALQAMGLGTVIWGITETRKQFGHTPTLKLAVSWLRRFPLIRRPAFLQPDGITVGASITGIRLTSVFTPKPDVPDRVPGRGVRSDQKVIDSGKVGKPISLRPRAS